MVGGFPCQSFSIAGKRRGFDEARGTLFFEIARILRVKRPRCVVLENVKGLLSHDGGKTFQVILKVLSDIGYGVEWQVLNSKNFGVPQNRERVFIVGHLRGTSRPEVFPIGESSSRNIKPQKETQGERQRIRSDVASTLAQRDYKGGNNLLDDGAKIRRFTPTECERLQGFPDGWTELGVIHNTQEYIKKCALKGKVPEEYVVKKISDTQRYKCLGNAVTTNVITAIFNKII